MNFGWVVFNSPTLLSGIRYCLAMLGRYEHSISIDPVIIYNLQQYGVFIVLGILFSTPIMRIVKEKIDRTRASYITALLEPIGYGLILLWGVSFLILGAHNPFIYFNF